MNSQNRALWGAFTMLYVLVLVAAVLAGVQAANWVIDKRWERCLEEHYVCQQVEGEVVPYVPDEG